MLPNKSAWYQVSWCRPEALSHSHNAYITTMPHQCLLATVLHSTPIYHLYHRQLMAFVIFMRYTVNLFQEFCHNSGLPMEQSRLCSEICSSSMRKSPTNVLVCCSAPENIGEDWKLGSARLGPSVMGPATV